MAVVVRDGAFLVIRRSRHVAAPGAYCFPGGGIEPGEDEAEALRREMREELGVDVRLGPRLWECVTTWGVWLAWWQAELLDADRLSPNPQEVESVHWLAADELRQLEAILSSNLAFLDALDRGDVRLQGAG